MNKISAIYDRPKANDHMCQLVKVDIKRNLCNPRKVRGVYIKVSRKSGSCSPGPLTNSASKDKKIDPYIPYFPKQSFVIREQNGGECNLIAFVLIPSLREASFVTV